MADQPDFSKDETLWTTGNIEESIWNSGAKISLEFSIRSWDGGAAKIAIHRWHSEEARPKQTIRFTPRAAQVVIDNLTLALKHVENGALIAGEAGAVADKLTATMKRSEKRPLAENVSSSEGGNAGAQAPDIDGDIPF